jgi:hypothetical protein
MDEKWEEIMNSVSLHNAYNLRQIFQTSVWPDRIKLKTSIVLAILWSPAILIVSKWQVMAISSSPTSALTITSNFIMLYIIGMVVKELSDKSNRPKQKGIMLVIIC